MAVTLFNGCVLVYELPDPPQSKVVESTSVANPTPNDSFLKQANNKSSSNFLTD